MKKGCVLFIDNQARAFLTHRLPLARCVQKLGIPVVIAAPASVELQMIGSLGFRTCAIGLDRSGINPLSELRTFFELAWLLVKFSPEIVHLKSPKIWCYGGVLAIFLGARGVVSHVVGLGFAKTGLGLKAHIARLVTRLFIGISFRHPRLRVIVQNKDDFRDLCKSAKSSKVKLVRGSGVDSSFFCSSPVPAVSSIVVFPARLLIDKGVREFVQAASIVRAAVPNARMVLVGGIDEGNPMSIGRLELNRWVEKADVEWWGQVEDMRAVFASSKIVCLPSWREGLAKVLLEAMSCGRPVIGADAPGTREPIMNGINGLLVPLRSPEKLAETIIKLLENHSLCQSMGTSGRKMVDENFCLDVIVSQTVRVFAELSNEINVAITRK